MTGKFHNKPPLPGQGDLPFTRGTQLAVLKQCRFGSATRRSIVLTLDDRIGALRSYKLTVGEIADQAEVHSNTAYRVLKDLQDENLIGCATARDGRNEYWLCWGTLHDLARGITAHEERETGEVPESVLAGVGEIQPKENELHSRGNHVQSNENLILSGVNAYKEERPSSAHSSSPSAPSDGAASQRTEVMVLVKECGVGQFARAVDEALAHGSTLPQISETVEHFRRHPGRWPPGVLFERLTRRGAELLSPAEGWFGDLPAWTSEQRQRAAQAAVRATEETEAVPIWEDPLTRQLNDEYGAALDQLTPAVQAELLDEGFHRQVFRRMTDGAKSPMYRPMLLAALARREKQLVPQVTQSEMF